MNGAALIGAFNKVTYFKTLQSNPNRTGRVVNLIFFNLAAISQIATAALVFNIASNLVILLTTQPTVAEYGLKGTAAGLSFIYLLLEKFYTRIYFGKYEKALCSKRHELPLSNKRALTYYTLSDTFFLLNWVFYLVNFPFLLCFL